jgi:hypothetical protein
MSDTQITKLPEPIIPNSEAEAELEDRAFHGAGHQDLPEWAHKLIGDLWHEVVAREAWYFALNPEEAAPRDAATGEIIPEAAPND